MGVDSDVLNVPVKIYSLKYDLAGNPINKYDLETTIQKVIDIIEKH